MGWMSGLDAADGTAVDEGVAGVSGIEINAANDSGNRVEGWMGG